MFWNDLALGEKYLPNEKLQYQLRLDSALSLLQPSLYLITGIDAPSKFPE